MNHQREGSTFSNRYGHHKRMGSDAFEQQSHTIISGPTSLNATAADFSNLGATREESQINMPQQKQELVVGGFIRDDMSQANSSIRNIPNAFADCNVIFPFAAYMPTLESSATGFNTPIET